MLSLLRTRRWLSFTVIVLLVIVAFGLLSRWQWSRAAEKQALGSSMSTARERPPLAPAVAETEWTPVSASGMYEPSYTVVVRKRPQETVNGFWVLTPLRTESGTLWVNRGWIRALGNATALPDIPPAPTGMVTVTGMWRSWQKARSTSGLPAGMVSDVDPAVLPRDTAFTGYLQLTESIPPQVGLDAVLLPEIDDAQNISYAVQWILFALVCIGGWFFFLRREAREDAAIARQED